MGGCCVAPLVGAWIEMLSFYPVVPLPLASLPSWERGLKSCMRGDDVAWLQSLPSWERGLKSTIAIAAVTWEIVAPLVGAWIEITIHLTDNRRG